MDLIMKIGVGITLLAIWEFVPNGHTFVIGFLGALSVDVFTLMHKQK